MNMLCMNLYNNPVGSRMRKVFICTPLGTFSAFCYMFFVFLGDYNSYVLEDITLKFSASLSCVEVTKCVNFQIPSLMGFKVGIFRISPIGQLYLLSQPTKNS